MASLLIWVVVHGTEVKVLAVSQVLVLGSDVSFFVYKSE